MSTQTQQLTQSLSANTAERGDPKLKKKFLLTKPTYRPNHIGAKGGIACQQPLPALPPASPPGTMPPPSSVTTTGHDPPPPPVQCSNGAKIAIPTAAPRHKSGAITYFDCRCTTAAPPPSSTPRRRHPHRLNQLPAITPPPHLPAASFFRFFSASKTQKAV